MDSHLHIISPSRSDTLLPIGYKQGPDQGPKIVILLAGLLIGQGGLPDITTVMDFRIAGEEFHYFSHLSDAIVERPLLTNNHIEILYNGDRAYPEMLEAISEAREYVFLSTYIFESDQTGNKFIQELERDCQRGAEVKVLVDGIGELYSLPRVGKLLKRKQIPFARFLPPKIFPPSPYINLRNHRKLLILEDEISVDGNSGFTGGNEYQGSAFAGQRK